MTLILIKKSLQLFFISIYLCVCIYIYACVVVYLLEMGLQASVECSACYVGVGILTSASIIRQNISQILLWSLLFILPNVYIAQFSSIAQMEFFKFQMFNLVSLLFSSMSLNTFTLFYIFDYHQNLN